MAYLYILHIFNTKYMIYILDNSKWIMEYITHADDNDIGSIRVTKRTRRKLGMLVDGNHTIDESLEAILDKLLVDKK